jgi:hypothetical protein
MEAGFRLSGTSLPSPSRCFGSVHEMREHGGDGIDDDSAHLATHAVGTAGVGSDRELRRPTRRAVMDT